MKNALVIESPQTLVLFSYSTPVAFFDKIEKEVYRTKTSHSRTTTRHINLFFKNYIISQHLSAFNPILIEQEKLNKMFPLTVTRL